MDAPDAAAEPAYAHPGVAAFYAFFKVRKVSWSFFDGNVFFFFFFFQRSLKSPPLANLLSRKKFFLTARFSSLPFPKTTDLCPARLHPLRPLLQVLRRELCRRHRPADGGLLDREFFIAVFSLSLFSLSSPLRLALPPSLSLSLSHSLSLPPKPNPKTKTK